MNFNIILYSHMNMDYSVCQALQYNSRGLSECLVIYDIACSWSVHFEERVTSSPILNQPDGMTLIPGVGKFHLASHRPECFAKYSLNFIQGAGQQDGEILETLWAPLNKVSGSIRAMSKSHRQEVLDALMQDNNWKKMVQIGMNY
jgi:hypothetical protein